METWYTCGESAFHAALMLQEDGQMVIRDEAGSEVFVYSSFTPQKAREVLRDIYLFVKDDLMEEYSWNEREKADAASQGRKANFRDEAYYIFWRSLEICLSR